MLTISQALEYLGAQAPTESWTIIQLSSAACAAGVLICKKKFETGGLHSGEWYRNDVVREEIRERGLKPLLERPFPGVALNVLCIDDIDDVMCGEELSWEDVQIEWLRHGGRMCWIPARHTGDAAARWVPLED